MQQHTINKEKFFGYKLMMDRVRDANGSGSVWNYIVSRSGPVYKGRIWFWFRCGTYYMVTNLDMVPIPLLCWVSQPFFKVSPLLNHRCRGPWQSKNDSLLARRARTSLQSIVNLNYQNVLFFYNHFEFESSHWNLYGLYSKPD